MSSNWIYMYDPVFFGCMYFTHILTLLDVTVYGYSTCIDAKHDFYMYTYSILLFGHSGTVLNWFSMYLTGRQYFVNLR